MRHPQLKLGSIEVQVLLSLSGEKPPAKEEIEYEIVGSKKVTKYPSLVRDAIRRLGELDFLEETKDEYKLTGLGKSQAEIIRSLKAKGKLKTTN